MDEKVTSEEELNYVKVFKKVARVLFGKEKPPFLIKILSIILITIHLVEFVLFSLVSIFVLLSPDRYYEKSVLEDFSDLGDDFFYAYTFFQIIILAILLLVWRKKIVGVYLYTIFSMVEIIVPYFLVKNTGFPWLLLLINLCVVLSLFLLVGKENRTEELEEDEDLEIEITEQ